MAICRSPGINSTAEKGLPLSGSGWGWARPDFRVGMEALLTKLVYTITCSWTTLAGDAKIAGSHARGRSGPRAALPHLVRQDGRGGPDLRHQPAHHRGQPTGDGHLAPAHRSADSRLRFEQGA